MDNTTPPDLDGANSVKMPKVDWDDADATTQYASIGSVMGRREEMIMVFGNADTWRQGADSVQVKIGHRVIMNPFTFKRFVHILEQGMKQYEDRFGEIKLD